MQACMRALAAQAEAQYTNIEAEARRLRRRLSGSSFSFWPDTSLGEQVLLQQIAGQTAKCVDCSNFMCPACAPSARTCECCQQLFCQAPTCGPVHGFKKSCGCSALCSACFRAQLEQRSLSVCSGCDEAQCEDCDDMRFCTSCEDSWCTGCQDVQGCVDCGDGALCALCIDDDANAGTLTQCAMCAQHWCVDCEETTQCGISDSPEESSIAGCGVHFCEECIAASPFQPCSNCNALLCARCISTEDIAQQRRLVCASCKPILIQKFHLAKARRLELTRLGGFQRAALEFTVSASSCAIQDAVSLSRCLAENVAKLTSGSPITLSCRAECERLVRRFEEGHGWRATSMAYGMGVIAMELANLCAEASQGPPLPFLSTSWCRMQAEKNSIRSKVEAEISSLHVYYKQDRSGVLLASLKAAQAVETKDALTLMSLDTSKLLQQTHQKARDAFFSAFDEPEPEPEPQPMVLETKQRKAIWLKHTVSGS